MLPVSRCIHKNLYSTTLLYCRYSSKLSQTCDDVHFMWKDIQLSKGQLNKKRLISADVAGKKEEIYYSSAPCLGVKVCPHKEYDYVVSIHDKQCCPKHNLPLERTSGCPVEFVYVHPKDPNDKRRWIGGLVRCQKDPSDNLHNHLLHGASKFLSASSLK